MVAAYALLLASTVAPAELDAATLARSIAAKSGGQSVVALADGRTVTADESGTVEALTADLKKENVRYFPGGTPGAVTIAYFDFLPDAAMPTIARLRPPYRARKPKLVEMPMEALAGGKVSFVTEPGSAVNLSMLPKLRWSLPLKLSPAFTNTLTTFDLGVSVKDLDEAEFLRAIAKAIGGRYRTDGKNLHLEASGSELRARALRTIELAAREPRKDGETAMDLGEAQTGEEGEAAPQPVRQTRRGGRGSAPVNPATIGAQLDLARAVTTSVSGRDFERFVSGEIEAVTINLAGQTNAQNALVRLLRANAPSPRDVNRVNSLLQSVPPRAPGSIVLGNGFSIDATLNTLDRRGNPGRTVRLKVL